MSTSSRLYLDVQPAVHGALGPFFVDSTDRRPDEKDDQAGQAEPRRDNKEELQALVPVETTLTTGMAGRAEDLLALIGRRKENIVDAFYDIRKRTSSSRWRESCRATAIRRGQERAYALAALDAATPDADSASSLVAKGVKVRGKVRDVSNMSRREIEEVRGPTNGPAHT